jgi:hypothetical protein
MRKVALTFGLIALGISHDAHAGDVVAVGVGLLGHLGGAASTGLGPSDVTKAAMNGPMGSDLTKAGPSFGGAYGGIGAMAELRLIKMLGIEVDYTRTLVTASGKVPLGAAFPNPTGGPGLPDVDLTFQQWQHQIAILGKFALATPLIAPFIAVGPEFVFPDDASKSCMAGGMLQPGACPISVKPTVPGVNITAHASSFTMLTGVVGLELKLPIPKIDIRIPVAARFSYNLSTPDNPAVCGSINGMQLDASVPTGGNCRLQFTGTLSQSTQNLVIDYRTEWKYMVGGQVGLAVYF